MKKFIALLSAAVLFSSMTVFAATSPSAGAVVASSGEGFAQQADAQAAAQRGLSAAEYYNNTVVSAPGVEDSMPVGQGGKILINGVATNLTATLARVDKTVAADAKAQAAALGGKALNVINVSFPGANYQVATINFYLKGLEAGKKIVARQYVNGEWIEVEVVEIREEHVVLNLTGSGAVVFVELP